MTILRFDHQTLLKIIIKLRSLYSVSSLLSLFALPLRDLLFLCTVTAHLRVRSSSTSIVLGSEYHPLFIPCQGRALLGCNECASPNPSPLKNSSLFQAPCPKVPGVVKDCAANRFRRARCNNIKCILGDNHLSSRPYVI
jgi:hypothetical protein